MDTEVADMKVGAFCGESLFEIDMESGAFSVVTSLPGPIRAAAATSPGDIYFSVKTSLYRIRKDRLRST
ncbi:hypothetical protein [Paenibacillus sp. GCM10012303]|uniref:hypothetical protein n=1 Tax=Paenibacillus sp. GCM10012303 TaxID=3317340 RepID=UPI00361850E4